MGSTGIFEIDEDFEDDSYDSSDSNDDNFDPLCQSAEIFLQVRSHTQIHLRVLITARAVFSS